MADYNQYDPGCCGCGAGCTTGTICFDLSELCTPNSYGYDYEITGSESTYTGNTATANCVADLPFGDYGVTATKSGCVSFEWSVTISSCSTTTLTGLAQCSTNDAVNFSVKGCFGYPLEGAVCTLSGVASGSCTTGSDGTCSLYTDATTGVGKTMTFTIHHPSGRFVDSTGSVFKSSRCTAASVARTLSIATGFSCCSILQNGTEAMPVKLPLLLTDAGGTISIPTCASSVCVDRDMGTCSPTVASSTTCPQCSCAGGGTHDMPATDIGTYAVALQWGLNLSTTPTVKQSHYMFYWSSAGGLQYRADCFTTSQCSPVDTRQTWRFSKLCGTGFNTGYLGIRDDLSSSFTVGSYYPLNLTFFFDTGDGFGPVPVSQSVGGEPYCLSCVVTESP